MFLQKIYVSSNFIESSNRVKIVLNVIYKLGSDLKN